MSDTSTPAQTTNTPSNKGHGLTARVGPLPIWGWVAVAIGAIIIYKIIKDHQASSAAGGTVAGANNAASTFGTEGFSTNSAGQLVDNATGDILGSIGGTTGSTSGSGTTTAATWFANAQQTLFNLGYDSGSVDQALQDYAAGNPLNTTEFGIIEAAIRLTGNPPTGIALPTAPTSGSGGTVASTLTSGIKTLGQWGGTTGGFEGTPWANFITVAPGQVIPNGIQLFYESVPGSGIFEPINNLQSLAPNTQLYIMENSNQPTGYQQGNNNPGTQTIGKTGPVAAAA